MYIRNFQLLEIADCLHVKNDGKIEDVIERINIAVGYDVVNYTYTNKGSVKASISKPFYYDYYINGNVKEKKINEFIHSIKDKYKNFRYKIVAEHGIIEIYSAQVFKIFYYIEDILNPKEDPYKNEPVTKTSQPCMKGANYESDK